MSRFPSWYFRPMDGGEVQVDPVHDEFFKMQDLADALVRESVQNSLDARRTRAAVRVRFRFATGPSALHADAAREYFGGLREHLDAVGASMHSAIPRDDEAVPYLLIEDFGTRGLTGDPAIDPELEGSGEGKNDFYYFWRNVGRSNKGEVDRGRWGLGKSVFTVASRIRTIFGLTRRADDERALLLGQSVLKTHIIDGARRYPYGFFARFEKRNPLPLPIEEPILLERFFDDFRLGRTEPGLSIVVPYFRHDDLSFEKILSSSIRQYFYPITRGDLVIEVIEGMRNETISMKSIDDVSRRFCGEAASSIERLAALTRWSIAGASDVRIQIAAQRGGAPKWTDQLFGDHLETLRERFEAGERLAIRAELMIKRKRASAPARSWFDVYLEKDESLKRGEPHFIRRGITIPDVKSVVDKPARILIVIDDDALSTFLGDAENPAHSDWSERADKLRTLYDHHAYTLRFVKNSAAAIASMVARPPVGRARNFLEDIFSIEAMGDSVENVPAAGAEPEEALGSSSPKRSKPAGTGTAGVTVSRVAGGFTLRGSGNDALAGKSFHAELAYRIRVGNPFRKHSRWDFDLANDTPAIDVTGAEVRSRDANVLQFVVQSPRFRVTVKGFDPRRDLLLRLAEMGADAPEA